METIHDQTNTIIVLLATYAIKCRITHGYMLELLEKNDDADEIKKVKKEMTLHGVCLRKTADICCKMINDLYNEGRNNEKTE